MKLNLKIIIPILILVAFIITLIFLFNKKGEGYPPGQLPGEGYILPSESSEVSKYKIFKEFLTISDLNQLQLVNQETRRLVLSLINQLFGYTSFSELKNLKIFTLYSTEEKSFQDFEIFYYLLSILQPKVLRKSKNLFQTWNPHTNTFILADLSNLNISVENKNNNNLLQLPEGENLIGRLYTISPFDEMIRQFSLTIRANTNVELTSKLIQLATLINDTKKASVFLVQDGLNFVFNLDIENFNRLETNNFNLNIYFKEDEIEDEMKEDEDDEDEMKDEEPEFEFPMEWFISQLVYSMRLSNPRNFASLLREIDDKILKRKVEEIIGYFTSPNFSKFQQIFEDEVRNIIRRNPKLFTKERIEALHNRLEQLKMMNAFEPQVGNNFFNPPPPQIIVPQNQVIIPDEEDLMNNAWNVVPLPAPAPAE